MQAKFCGSCFSSDSGLQTAQTADILAGNLFMRSLHKFRQTLGDTVMHLDRCAAMTPVQFPPEHELTCNQGDEQYM